MILRDIQVTTQRGFNMASDIVVKTIVGEGANQDPEGLYAIASTIVNRARKRGKTLEQIVNQPHQYTGRWRKDLDDFVAKQPPSVLKAAQEALQKAIKNPIPGIDHYMTNRLYNSPHRPSWTNKMKIFKVIGDHTFLKGAKLMPQRTFQTNPQSILNEKERKLMAYDRLVQGLFGQPLTPEELRKLAGGNPSQITPKASGIMAFNQNPNSNQGQRRLI